MEFKEIKTDSGLSRVLVVPSDRAYGFFEVTDFDDKRRNIGSMLLFCYKEGDSEPTPATKVPKDTNTVFWSYYVPTEEGDNTSFHTDRYIGYVNTSNLVDRTDTPLRPTFVLSFAERPQVANIRY